MEVIFKFETNFPNINKVVPGTNLNYVPFGISNLFTKIYGQTVGRTNIGTIDMGLNN